ncbi:MAG: hypothetical protein H0V40_09015, partial [Actinobacteria bacterium]|nr:hypothetical protein [Actinomycetota bacterium]
MAGSVDRRALDYAVELEEADERLAALIRALVELEREAAELTLQAAAGEELAARYPAERERLERSAAELGELARGRRAELAQAEGQLASAEGQRRPNVEAVAAARRLVVRTRDLLQIALDRLGQAENAAQELEA